MLSTHAVRLFGLKCDLNLLKAVVVAGATAVVAVAPLIGGDL
jgi:hypothetical protein